MRRLLPLLLVLCGCAGAVVAARAAVPTLYVENLTDSQLAVYVIGRHAAIARVPGMGTACVKLTDLSPGATVLAFRALADGTRRTMPTDYATDAGWSVTITSASYDGGFFAKPAPRCRA